MNVLPHFIYIKSGLPLLFDKVFFKIINSLFSSFIWNGKARISISKLLLDQDRDGMGLQNLEKYLIVINSRYPVKWAYNHNIEMTSWEEIEKNG